MSALMKFSFNGRGLDVMIGDDGEPRFIASQVCEHLLVGNVSDAISRLDDDEKGIGIVDTLGGPQECLVVTEAGLYALVLGSRKPEAKPFKRWVTHEVLPALRKTGRYEVPKASAPRLRGPTLAQARIKLLVHAELSRSLAAVTGVQQDVATCVYLDSVGREFGVDIEPYRRALPPRKEAPAGLTPTKIAGIVGGISAKEVNIRLTDLGLQVRNAANDLVLTEAGAKFGEMKPYNRNGHSGLQIEWRLDVVPLVERRELPEAKNVLEVVDAATPVAEPLS